MFLQCEIIVCLFLITAARYLTEEDEISERDQMLRSEESKTIGASITLSYAESVVNDFLMKMKLKELDEGFSEPSSFIPARHLFDTLGKIEGSEIFQFIKDLPKGSALHGHFPAIVSFDFLYNITFSENLYACFANDTICLKFMKEPIVNKECSWKPIKSLRESVRGFEEILKSHLTLIREDYKSVYTDINIVWTHFLDRFATITPLISYRPIFRDYYYQALKELVEDNVFYIEFRSSLKSVYDLDGNTYGPVDVAALFKETTEEFMKDYPDFLGAKLIYARGRYSSKDKMPAYIEIVNSLKKNVPDFFAGFDLVGQDDTTLPLIEFVDHLEEMEGINLFLHAGETNWFGSVDEGLIDAVLLEPVRIGHGFAAVKHPNVLEVIKAKNIAIEICPISNQVLKLVGDMRNHPGSYYISNGFPVVVGNDDPSFWGTKGLTYDWYMVYMGMTSRKTDLRFLKQLALNSIEYSVYHNKTLAKNMWKSQWNKFIYDYITKIQKIKE